MKKLSLILLLVVALFACKKNSNPLPSPIITGFDMVASDTTIAMGNTINFAPKTNNNEGNGYLWQLNDKSVATTANYTFNPTQSGVYNLTYTVTNESGKASKEVKITVKEFLGGMYIVNEGWFGHEMGSVNHFDATTQTLSPRVFQKYNPTLTLGITTCYGTTWMGQMYFVSKQGRRLVAADVLTLKESGALEVIGGDGRAFAGIDAKLGVVTTTKGAFKVSLQPLALGSVIETTKGEECGGVYATEKYIFIINQSKGLQIFSVADNMALVKTEAGVGVGFAKAKDGSLWAAAGKELIQINTQTLVTLRVALPSGVTVANSWGAWNAGSLCASTKENALFFTKGGAWGGGREIYRYTIGSVESLNTVFAKSTMTDDTFYGSGISIDPTSGDVVATFVKDGYGQNYKDNRLVIFDGKTGAEKSRTKFEGFYFPSGIIFNN
ncbi:MAG: DUF5074 domain-containing protein [Mucinivorans sp.]